jgi:hypothetical protein
MGLVKKNKAIIHVGLCVLVWTIKNCRNGLVFNRVSTLQVIHMADSLIDMWSYLIPVKHREPINYGCNRKMAVVRLYWARVVGFVINVYKMHRAFLCSLFRWMLNVATSSNSWDVNFDTINYTIKLRLCSSIRCRGRGWAPISNKMSILLYSFCF